MSTRSVSSNRVLIKNVPYSISITGANDNVSLTFTNTATYSVCFWMKANSLGGGNAGRIFNNASGDFSLLAPGNIITVSHGASAVSSDSIFQIGEWVHIAWTYDGSNVKFYKNGILNKTVAQATAYNIGSIATTFFNRSSNTRQLDGKIFDFMWFTSRVLTSSEIINYKRGLITDNTNRHFYWKFNEGSGAIAIDSSGNGRNGTINGGAYSTDTFFKSRSAATNRFLLPTSAQKSLSFNGTSDAATASVAPDVTGFNYSFWVYRARGGVANGERFLSWEYNTPTDGFALGWSSNSLAIGFNIFNNGSTVVGIVTTQTFPQGRWYFITVTYKVNEAKLYVDGVLLNTDTVCTMREPTVAQTLTFGKRSYTGISYLLGKIKNLTFQNATTPWTTQQISDLYYRNVIPTGAKQYSMNDVDTDQNGANALTLTGTSYSTIVPDHMNIRSSI